MQPQENPARVLLGLHGDCTEGFLLKNLCCLECTYVFVCAHVFIHIRLTSVHLISGRKKVKVMTLPLVHTWPTISTGSFLFENLINWTFFIKPNWEWNHANTCIYHAGLSVFAVVTVYIRVETRPKSRLCCAAIPRKTNKLLVEYFIIHKPMFSIGMNFLQFMWVR